MNNQLPYVLAGITHRKRAEPVKRFRLTEQSTESFNTNNKMTLKQKNKKEISTNDLLFQERRMSDMK